ncbi:MAG TPA: Y-family DNA polymerase [Candidatus Saccharimonadales bacterium]|nr:Y-family DNA polymerase [Candidatus Saccharimonadales bacterium]
MKTVFALIDCNNFFVSCERLFRPDLEGRPVVVLSSNDGCVVSRSAEAKRLGIPMGAPDFKYRPLFEREGVVRFSVNFELYGDISQRITRLLSGITPRTEVYSVDEAFLELGQLEINDYRHWGLAVRQRLLREVGIPVSMGVAPSKTLAKLASEQAKTNPALGGVLDLLTISEAERAAYLRATPIKDIWGVGWRLAPRLQAEGAYNALDLAGLAPRRAQQLMGIPGRQLIAELNGQSCRPLEPYGRVRQTVMKGRMFGEDTNQFEVIEAAIASLTARAALALRREGLAALGASLSLSTDRHKPGYQRRQHSVRFRAPTADTGRITAALVETARAGFNPTPSYHRANVLLYNLVSEQALQPDLFGSIKPADAQVARARLRAVDSLNQRYGSRTVRYAAEDLSEAWHPRQKHRSPRYTTEWQELPILQPSLPARPTDR